MAIVAPGSARVVAAFLLGLVVTAASFAEPLTLADCTRLALTHNLEAEQARGDLQAAQAGVVGARSAFLPRVTASGGWTKSEDPTANFQSGDVSVYPDSFWRMQAGASLTLFDGFGNVYGYRQARGARSAAQDRYRKARQDVVYETERRFFEVRRQEALLQVQQQAVELSAEQLKKTTAMKELGAATQADVYKAEVDRSNSQLQQLRTERDLEVAKASLASYLGRDPRESVELAPEEPTLAEPPDLSAAIDRALRMNPSLTAARADLSASRSGVGAAKADRYPSLTLSGNTNFSNFQLESFNDHHVESTVGLSLDFTVFDGFLTKSQIRRAEATLLKTRRAAESAERDVVLAVRQAYLDLEIARRSIDVGEEAVRSSEEDLRLAQERYRLGEGTILDVIDAQVNLTRSRTSLENARFDARLALSTLNSAVGDLAVPETAE